MNITEEQKADILLAMLEHRYGAIERIRDRVYGFAIWTLGIFLGVTGLVLEGTLQPGPTGRWVLSFAAFLALAAIVFYIRDLEKGFCNQLRVAIRVETLLGFYETGVYDSAGGLYPPSWASAGTAAGQGRFFRMTYLLLCLGAAVLVVTVSLAGMAF